MQECQKLHQNHAQQVFTSQNKILNISIYISINISIFIAMEILGFKVADVGATFMYFSKGNVQLILNFNLNTIYILP